MTRKQILLCMMFLISVFLVACGQSSATPKQQLEQETASQDFEKTAIQVDNNKTKEVQADQKDDQVVKKVKIEEIIALLSTIDEVRTEIVHTIEANGWYGSIGEIEPTVDEFEEVVRPIASPYFTNQFINDRIIEQMDAFFCYCDASGPLLGSMNPDVLQGIKQNGKTATLDAYVPSDQINSGLKVNVTIKKQEGQWKIDSFKPLYSSHETSFALTTDQILAYYQAKGIKVEHIDTMRAGNSNEEVYIFEKVQSDTLVAIHSRNWLTVEGEEQLKQRYGYSNEE